MNLDTLENHSKDFVKRIVDGYIKGEQYIRDGKMHLRQPGMWVDNIFADIKDDKVCAISFHRGENNSICVCYTFHPGLLDNGADAQTRYINLKRAELIYNITLLKRLNESGYISLVDDKNYNLFDTGSITEEDKKNWTDAGILYYEETIQSELLFEILSQYHNCRIIPSPQLMDYTDNSFRTPEKRRHFWTQVVSWTAIAVAIFIPLLVSKCSYSKIDPVQIDSIINAIHEPIKHIQPVNHELDSIAIIQKNNTNNE